jgi:hypothetical protein
MIYFLHNEVNQFEDWPCDILYFPPLFPILTFGILKHKNQKHIIYYICLH